MESCRPLELVGLGLVHSHPDRCLVGLEVLSWLVVESGCGFVNEGHGWLLVAHVLRVDHLLGEFDQEPKGA